MRDRIDHLRDELKKTFSVDTPLLTNLRKMEEEFDRDDTFCREHGCYFVECGKLGHGKDFNPKETL